MLNQVQHDFILFFLFSIRSFLALEVTELLVADLQPVIADLLSVIFKAQYQKTKDCLLALEVTELLVADLQPVFADL